MKNTVRTFSRGYLESTHGQSPICLLGSRTVSMQTNGIHFHSDRYLPTMISFIRNCPMLPYPYIRSECRTGFLYEIRTQCSPEMDVWNCVSETLHDLLLLLMMSFTFFSKEDIGRFLMNEIVVGEYLSEWKCIPNSKYHFIFRGYLPSKLSFSYKSGATKPSFACTVKKLYDV